MFKQRRWFQISDLSLSSNYLLWLGLWHIVVCDIKACFTLLLLRLPAFIPVGNTFNFVLRNLCLHQLLIIFTACEDRLTIWASDILIAVLCRGGNRTRWCGSQLTPWHARVSVRATQWCKPIYCSIMVQIVMSFVTCCKYLQSNFKRHTWSRIVVKTAWIHERFLISLMQFCVK